ncbi:phakinin isoform X2 [Artibeus jamaicensis]|uniref:phakinin isoform X2 n=1 Tax=Artibeus jamaicensis TaxID=9417 RepID=UPI00235AD1C2|nr:phakinin isoform X2 [Artibeus jamaicensis]
MSSRPVVVDVPTSTGMSLQRHRASFRGTRSLSSLHSPQASRTSAIGGLVRAPRVYVGMAPSGYAGGLVARVTRRAMGISSVFLQGLQSSGLAVAPAPSLERDLGAVEDLGDCLVEYMAKVHALEQAIQDLEAQLRMHLESKAGSCEKWGALRASWASSCQQVGEAVLENARLMLQTESIQAGVDDFKERVTRPGDEKDDTAISSLSLPFPTTQLLHVLRYENEQPCRKAVEEEINSLYKVIDEAHWTKIDLEGQIESLKEELGFLSRSYEEDVKALYKQLAVSELEQVGVPMGTGLDDILQTIRTHWERDVEKNRMEAGVLLQAQQAEVARLAQTQEEKLAAALRAEVHDASCQVQSLQAETESLRVLKRGLENTLHDAKHWHDLELQNLGAVVSRLEAELREVRAEAEQQQQAREHLLAHRCQLQRDLASYHALLDREESNQ